MTDVPLNTTRGATVDADVYLRAALVRSWRMTATAPADVSGALYEIMKTSSCPDVQKQMLIVLDLLVAGNPLQGYDSPQVP